MHPNLLLPFSSCDKDKALTIPFDVYPVTEFVGQEGNEKVLLNWEHPRKESPVTYIVSWSSGKGVEEIKSSSESYEITGLSDGTEYTFSIQASYADLGFRQLRKLN